MIFHCSLGDKIISNNDDMKCIKGDPKKKNVPLGEKKRKPQAGKHHGTKHFVEARG